MRFPMRRISKPSLFLLGGKFVRQSSLKKLQCPFGTRDTAVAASVGLGFTISRTLAWLCEWVAQPKDQLELMATTYSNGQ
jgi:hypothetical protein